MTIDDRIEQAVDQEADASARGEFAVQIPAANEGVDVES